MTKPRKTSFDLTKTGIGHYPKPSGFSARLMRNSIEFEFCHCADQIVTLALAGKLIVSKDFYLQQTKKYKVFVFHLQVFFFLFHVNDWALNQNRQPDWFLYRFLNQLHPKNKNEEEHKVEQVVYTSFFDYTGCINSHGRK